MLSHTHPTLCVRLQEPNDVSIDLSLCKFDRDALRLVFSASDSVWALRFGSRRAYEAMENEVERARVAAREENGM